jgi:hypothetical protein
MKAFFRFDLVIMLIPRSKTKKKDASKYSNSSKDYKGFKKRLRMKNLAEREGFEPSTGVASTRFPVVLLRPLGHLSTCEA